MIIDFSYKKNARKCYYDIEVLNELFSLCILTEGLMHFVIVPAAGVDMPSHEQLLDELKDFMNGEDAREAVGGDCDIRLEILDLESQDRGRALADRARLKVILYRMLRCQATFDESARFTEYYGWNSARYDLPMLALAFILLSTVSTTARPRSFTTRQLRRLSDIIIGTEGPQWVVYKEIETRTAGLITEREIKEVLRRAAYSDGHIDIAKIAKAQDGGAEAKFPPGLKREMARYGLDIVVDSLVTGQGGGSITPSDICRLSRYNCNDVVGTCLVGRNGLMVAGMFTRDIVREMYPFTSARSVPEDKIQFWNPPERDCSAAELAGRVLIGADRHKPQDYRCVKYDFPLPSGTQDLLEFIKSHEEFVPQDLYTFFDHFRGKDTTTARQDWLVKQAQPITHSATLNVPYYRDGKPIDCYIRVSTGGAHGSVMAGLSQYTDEDIYTWTRSDAGAEAHQKPTIDLKNVIHLDWSSFYPTMAAKLQLYRSSDGVDRYTDVIQKRFEIKASLGHDRSTWTQADVDLFNQEQGLKFVLNNATGAGNMHSKYALLPVDNKTLSMRLIGNMLIWCLAQRLAQAGAFIISTNTDGLYITGIELDEVHRIVDGYVNDYGMPVEPEIVPRFINRDTSNRIEYGENGVSVIGGRLNGGMKLRHADFMINHNVPQPLAVSNAVVRYMDDEDWLRKPYDRARLMSIMEGIREESHDLEPWYHVHAGTQTRKLLVDGQQLDKINRVALTLDGGTGTLATSRKLVKAHVEKILERYGDDLRAGRKVTGAQFADFIRDQGLDPCDKRIYTDEYWLSSISKQKDNSLLVTDTLVQAAVTGETIATDLAMIDPDGEAIPIRVWKESTTISGYPSNRISIANTHKAVHEFDLSRLDLEAYTDWAEQILLSWKVTADIPQLGLERFDDPAVAMNSSSRAQGSKSERALARLIAVYDACYT